MVYPNDHPPPHTHVLGPGWEIRIELSVPPALLTILGKPKVVEITAGPDGRRCAFEAAQNTLEHLA